MFGGWIIRSSSKVTFTYYYLNFLNDYLYPINQYHLNILINIFGVYEHNIGLLKIIF